MPTIFRRLSSARALKKRRVVWSRSPGKTLPPLTAVCVDTCLRRNVSNNQTRCKVRSVQAASLPVRPVDGDAQVRLLLVQKALVAPLELTGRQNVGEQGREVDLALTEEPEDVAGVLLDREAGVIGVERGIEPFERALQRHTPHMHLPQQWSHV